MKTKKTLIQVPGNTPLAFGSMNLVEGTYTEKEAESVLLTAWEHGIRLFDTANSYGCGEGEILLGKILPKEAILTTKCGLIRNAKGRYLGLNASPAAITQVCEASLRRLGREKIDIFFLHRIDPNVAVEESVGAMRELQAAGKVGVIGLCETSAPTLRRAQKEAEIAMLQSEYSLFSRDIEKEILAACRELGVGVLAYSPLCRGLLGRKIEREELEPKDFRRILPRFFIENLPANQTLFSVVEQISQSLNATPAQVALAWLLKQGEDIFPLFGATNPQHIAENTQAVKLRLPEPVLSTLNELASQVQGERYNPMGMRFINR